MQPVAGYALAGWESEGTLYTPYELTMLVPSAEMRFVAQMEAVESTQNASTLEELGQQFPAERFSSLG